MDGKREIIISGVTLLLGVVLVFAGNWLFGSAVTSTIGLILCALAALYIIWGLFKVNDDHRFYKFWEHRFILLVLGAAVTVQSVNYEHLFTKKVEEKEKYLNVKERFIEREKLSSTLTLSISDRLSYMRPVYYNLRDNDSADKLRENYKNYESVKDNWNKIWQDFSLRVDINFPKDKFPPSKFTTKNERIKFVKIDSFKQIFEEEIQERFIKLHANLLKYKDSYLLGGKKLTNKEKVSIQNDSDNIQYSFELFRQLLAEAVNYSNSELEKLLNEKPETVIPGNQ